jgi:hypothetical protein
MESTASQDRCELGKGEALLEIASPDVTPKEPTDASPTATPFNARLATFGFFASAVGVAAWTARMTFDPRFQRFAMTFPDSFDYFDVAKLGPLRFGEFFFGRRPIGYPLFIWALGATPGRVITVQIILYAIAWLYLISTVFRIWRSKVVAGITAIVLLSLGLHPKYSTWSVNTLSEGLATTSTVALVAAWLRWATWPDRRRLVTASVITLAWTSLRDSNAVNIVVIGGGLLGISVIRYLLEMRRVKLIRPSESDSREEAGSEIETRIDPQVIDGLASDSPTSQATVPVPANIQLREPKRSLFKSQPLALVLAIFVGFSLYQLFSQTVSKRARYAIYNNVGRDVLPNPELSKFFFDHGMPNPPALAARIGKDSWGDGPDSFLLNPQLASFRKWAEADGRNLMVRAIIVKSPLYWRMLAHDWKLFNGDGSGNYDTFGVYARAPKSPGRRALVAPSLNMMLYACIGGFGIALALARSRRDWRMALLGGLFSFGAVFDIYLCFVGDADERYRHIISGYLRLDLAALLAVSWAMDRLVQELSIVRSARQLGKAWS